MEGKLCVGRQGCYTYEKLNLGCFKCFGYGRGHKKRINKIRGANFADKQVTRTLECTHHIKKCVTCLESNCKQIK